MTPCHDIMRIDASKIKHFQYRIWCRYSLLLGKSLAVYIQCNNNRPQINQFEVKTVDKLKQIIKYPASKLSSEYQNRSIHIHRFTLTRDGGKKHVSSLLMACRKQATRVTIGIKKDNEIPKVPGFLC